MVWSFYFSQMFSQRWFHSFSENYSYFAFAFPAAIIFDFVYEQRSTQEIISHIRESVDKIYYFLLLIQMTFHHFQITSLAAFDRENFDSQSFLMKIFSWISVGFPVEIPDNSFFFAYSTELLPHFYFNSSSFL